MKKYRVLYIIFIVIAVISLGIGVTLWIGHEIELSKSQELMTDLRDLKQDITTNDVSSNIDLSTDNVSVQALSDESQNTVSENDDISANEETVFVNPYEAVFAKNSDMIAWLNIPDTNVDYPVMQTPEDENYYLYRGFDKQKNGNGCLIMDTDSDIATPGTNLIIHGHNQTSGEMFGKLSDYADQEYAAAHSTMTLTTKDEERHYELIAVFYSQVFYTTDECFKFYKFFQANTEAEFNDFYDNIMEMSVYDTDLTASFGDHFLTLSTCSYHVDNGRLVLVAKQIED